MIKAWKMLGKRPFTLKTVTMLYYTSLTEVREKRSDPSCRWKRPKHWPRKGSKELPCTIVGILAPPRNNDGRTNGQIDDEGYWGKKYWEKNG